MSDETDLFQLGLSTETEFYGPITTEFKKENHKYANDGDYIFSISLNLNANLNTINRKTDSLFDWMGAWGGMHDGLHAIAELLLHFLSVYSIKARLLRFTKYLPSAQSNENQSN